jgi:hypothetical protein
VPQANPDGSAKNERWFSSWSPSSGRSARAGSPAAVRLAEYFRWVHRDSPKDDVEFGFPDRPGGEARPENAAIAGWFDRLGRIDHYVSLHSMFLGGGALFLVRAPDLEASAPRLRFLLDETKANGLPLHDKDRFGQKGFHRICAGLMTAPTAEEMSAFFQSGKQSEVASHFKLNSMQYVERYAGCPLAFVSEIPLSYDPRLASMKPVEHTRAEEERRLAAGLTEVLDEGEALARRMGALALEPAGMLEAGISRLGAELRSGRAQAAALLGDLERYKDAPATEGNVLETKLLLLRRRAGIYAHAIAVLEAAPPPRAAELVALAAELEGKLNGVLARIGSEFDLRYPTLETQVRLQVAALLGALVRTEART